MAGPRGNMAVALFVHPAASAAPRRLTLTFRFSRFLDFFSTRFMTLWKGSRASWDP